MNEKHDLEELMDRQLRGELDESETERLAELLDSDPTARREFVEHAQWDTRFAEVLREKDVEECADAMFAERTATKHERPPRITLPRLLLAVSAVVIVTLSVGLLYQQSSANRRIAEITKVNQRPMAEPPIAKITGLSGTLIWTGDRGRIVRDVTVGTKLPGGTIEGMAPDSWFELEFNDGSTVMISGTTMLTFADAGQKELRLREGIFSANVVPQPEGKPMLIHTRSALLKVLGTQFGVEANLTSTVLNVSEGKVRVRRLSDGSEVDVPAKHQVVVEDDRDLTPELVPDSVHHWKSRLHRGPGGYGKWLPATAQQSGSQKATPFVPSKYPKVTLYLLSIPVSRSDSSPVVVQPDSQFVVRGRLNKRARVHFGIGVRHVNGEFAGKFRGDLGDRQPISELDSEGHFEAVYRLGDFTLDPCVRDRKDKLAGKPEGLVLNAVWAFTHTGGPSGLEVTEVELIPPVRHAPQHDADGGNSKHKDTEGKR
ncbi:MAG: FecR domain-containing protein [Planctomycetes bacterium]|nr:FecR domain-containing protein [Planctomycetota bacterium]